MSSFEVLGIYHDLAPEAWQPRLYSAASACPALYGLKDYNKWRVQLFLKREVDKIPVGAFESRQEIADLVAAERPRTAQPDTHRFRGIWVDRSSRAFLCLSSSNRLVSNRGAASRVIERRTGTDIRVLTGKESDLMNIFIGKATDRDQRATINAFLGNRLPEEITVEPLQVHGKDQEPEIVSSPDFAS